LTLNGRDSKIHVTDYDVDGVNLLYSSAEIFTWKKYDDKIVLILYGGPNERHEAAISSDSPLKVLEGGQDLKTLASDGTVRFNWPVSTTQRTVLRIGDVQIYLLGG
jgi:beta-galactosidase